ncbi:MAG: DUF1579 domain-containing protein [bacterium]|nr:DUF1579 domain-containing protein [bacterium]
MKKFNLLVLAGVMCCFAVGFAAEGGAPSMEEIMKACTEAAKVGPEHMALAKYVGAWDCAVKMWMDPTQPPMESKGSEVCEMAMGGRMLVGNFTGDMMGQPFHGQSQMGYSNFPKKYWATWMDDGSTGLMYCEGTASADGKTITMMGTYDDPMSNTQDKPWKQVITLVDDDHHMFAAYDKVGTPAEYKSMEITYTRKK